VTTAAEDEQTTDCLSTDPRIPKLLALCESVYKWVSAVILVENTRTSLLTILFSRQRLCIRQGMESWTHPSGAFTLLGDAVHATLPYLASGCVESSNLFTERIC
jgi:salicylate hydroxylase